MTWYASQIMTTGAPTIVSAIKRNPLHLDTNEPVAFYYCFCWGGDVEVEYAWLFGESERVLVRQTEKVPPHVNRLLEIAADTERELDDDVLVRTLRLLACEIPTPF